jgi:DNA-binding transcriptional LysR family regulator
MSYYTYLASFLRVYRTKSFSQASIDLSISQPTVTQHISILESRINKPLFNRHTRKVEATQTAKQLALMISPHLDALDMTIGLGNEEESKIGKLISFGGAADLFNDEVIQKLSSLLIDNYLVNFCIDIPEVIFKKLENDEIDFMFVSSNYLILNTDIFESIPIVNEEHILVGGEKYSNIISKKTRKEKVLKILGESPWIIFDEKYFFEKIYFSTVFNRVINESCFVKPSIITNNLFVIRDAIINNMGIGILPLHMCKDYLDRNVLQQLYFPRSPPLNSIVMVYKQVKKSTIIFHKIVSAICNIPN